MATILNSKAFIRAGLELNEHQTNEIKKIENKIPSIGSGPLNFIISICELGVQDLDSTFDRYLEVTSRGNGRGLLKDSLEILGEHYHKIYKDRKSIKSKLGKMNGKSLVEDVLAKNPIYKEHGIEYKDLSEYQIKQIEQVFNWKTRRELAGWHYSIICFVKYKLMNYKRRLEWLMPNETVRNFKSYIVRYGAIEGNRRYADDSYRRSLGAKNVPGHWIQQGYSKEEADEKVKEHNKYVANGYGRQCVEVLNEYHEVLNFWIRQGLSRSDATEKANNLRDNWNKKTSEEKRETVNKWITDFGARKPTDEDALRHLRKSLTVYSFLVRGLTDSIEEAEILLNKQMSKSRTVSPISQELFQVLDERVGGKLYYGHKSYEFPISGKNVDFYDAEGKTVIEFFGTFWHAFPEKYEADDMIMTKTASQIWQEDEERLDLLNNHPEVNHVIIVWEHEFLDNKDGTIDQIINEILTKRQLYGNTN